MATGRSTKWSVLRKAELQEFSKRQTTCSSGNQDSFCTFAYSILMFTFTTAAPHPKFSFSFSRQRLQKPFNSYCKLLIVVCIIVEVSFWQFPASGALASLQKKQQFSMIQPKSVKHDFMQLKVLSVNELKAYITILKRPQGQLSKTLESKKLFDPKSI